MMNRRDFFRVVAASGATAAASGCQRATETILPLVVPNEQIVPGVAAWFATVCRECPAGCGVIAKNREGRVVKLEGNPDHPVNQGALCARGQAALQGLYHPDRFTGPRLRDGAALKPVPWDAAQKVVADTLADLRSAAKGQAIALVTQLETSSLGALLDKWTQALGTRPRVTFEPFAYEALRAANRITFGRDAIPYFAFEDAEVVLSFGADFLETWLSNVNYARTFARMHTVRDGRAGTFIHVEPRQSLTASNADEWVRNAPGTEGLLALAILRVMVDEGMADRRFGEAVASVDVKRAADESGVSVETIKRVAKTFAHAKPGLAIGGGVSVTGTNATQTQIAINLLNAAAGNVGKTVRFGADSAYGKVTPYSEVANLAGAMAGGEIEVLILGPGVNPAFTLPSGLKLADAIRKVALVASFANVPDQTSELAHVVLPGTHWLESWGDYSPRDGVLGFLQPTMSPVRDSRPMGDTLLRIGRAALGAEEGKGPIPWPTFEQYLKAAWAPLVKGELEGALRRGGVFGDVAPATVSAKVSGGEVAPPKLAGDGGGLTLLAYPSLRFYDGRSAVSSWLQEAPDTMTQAVWDAWVEISTDTARKLGVAQGDMIAVKSPQGTLELPAYISPTLHPSAVAIPMGHRYTPYQRPRYVAADPRSLNPMDILPAAADSTSGGLAFMSVKVTLTKLGTRRPLAVLQATHDQDDRELAQHVELGAAREQALRGRGPEAAAPTLYEDQKYPGPRWGMTIDVDACVGCQACVVSCQAARCEPVCPVYAAYRTEEGLNGQVYNRCVGTRYCGNNCPYHVRRFNWFQYEFPTPLEVQLNPDVTVRQLGVMEKCTMCLQRIIAGKDRARDEKRAVRDGDILTACQQTCPTQAITFGNLKDEGSGAKKLTHSPRAYHVLEEIGTRPSITYLRKVVRGGHA